MNLHNMQANGIPGVPNPMNMVYSTHHQDPTQQLLQTPNPYGQHQNGEMTSHHIPPTSPHYHPHLHPPLIPMHPPQQPPPPQPQAPQQQSPCQPLSEPQQQSSSQAPPSQQEQRQDLNNMSSRNQVLETVPTSMPSNNTAIPSSTQSQTFDTSSSQNSIPNLGDDDDDENDDDDDDDDDDNDDSSQEDHDQDDDKPAVDDVDENEKKNNESKSKSQSPNIRTQVETDDYELTSGKDIISEANHVFKVKQGRKVTQVVSMAFRVTKKSSVDKRPKRVKVIITSRENIEKALKLSEEGKASDVLEKLREKPAVTKKKPVRKQPRRDVPPSIVPSWSIMEQMQAAMEQAMREGSAPFPDLMDGSDGIYYGDDVDDLNKDDDWGDDGWPDDNNEWGAGSSRKASKHDYEDLKDIKIKAEPGEELYGEDIINAMEQELHEEEEYEEKPVKLKLSKGKKRGRKKREKKADIEDDLLLAHESRKAEPNIPNTLEKSVQLTSMNLDDYIVMVAAEGETPRKRKDGDSLASGFGDGSTKQEPKDKGEDELYNINFGKTVKYYGCTYCSYTGKKMKWLHHLKNKHKDENIFFCTKTRLCSHPFISKELLDQHIKEAHDEKNKCEICQRCFKYPRDLRNHLPSHKSKEELEESGVGKHICPYCGKEFNTRAGYKTHEAQYHTMNLKHKCDWDGCDKAFYKLSSLKIHRRGHTGEKPFVCSFCGTGFVAKQRLVVHEKTMHLTDADQLDTECHICHRRLRKRYLKYHIRTTHEGKTQDSCRVCGKIFPTPPARKRHEKIHFDQKDFACRFCGKAFVQKANMEAHERTHTGEKPYQCKFCGEGFVQGTRRNVHQASCRQRPLVL